MDKKEINGNHYVVHVYPKDDGRNYLEKQKRTVIVYGSGSDHGMPKTPFDTPNLYAELARDVDQSEDAPVEQHVAAVVNEAICELEEKQDEGQSYADKLDAALEANKELHEGIEYQIEKDR